MGWELKMIDIQKSLIAAMKGQLFSEKQVNVAARQVLGEMKTKIKDLNSQITSEIQFKMLQKMKKDRQNSIKIYSEAMKETPSENCAINLKKAEDQLKPINVFLTQLEALMPKVLTEDETRRYVKGLLEILPEENRNIGMVMKQVKSRTDIKFDMAITSKIVKQELAK